MAQYLTDRELYLIGDKRCVSLRELEESVPAHVLIKFISCVFINRPTVRELVRQHGKTAWGSSAGNQADTGPKNSSSSATSSSSSSAAERNSSSSRRKRQAVSTSNGKKTSKNSQPIKIAPVVQLGAASFDRILPNVGLFSSLQILRSLAVCLKPLAAKKASIEWAEQYALENDVSDDVHKMIRKWKQKYSALEIKSKVHERRTRLSMSELKIKEIKKKQKQEWQKFFAEGQKLEESLLGRVEFKGSCANYDSPTSGNNDGGAEEDSSYSDDFESGKEDVDYY